MKMSYILVLAAIIIGYSISKAQAEEGFYVEGGLSVHLTSIDAPEIDFDRELGNIGFGYTFKNNVEVYIRHTSGLKTTEDGYGLNQLGINYRKYFK